VMLSSLARSIWLRPRALRFARTWVPICILAGSFGGKAASRVQR
jgi:hypothetical protein